MQKLVSSPAILYMLGIMSKRPCEAVKVVTSVPVCRPPWTAPMAPASSTSTSVPARSHDQRMRALEAANEIRTRRAQLKRDLKAGKVQIEGLLLDPPEYLETAKVFVDLLLQTARQLAAATVRLHPFPEVQMVVMLAGIVEHGRIFAERALDDLFERFALEFGPLDRVVAVGDIGLMMLVVVILQRLLGHIGAKSVMGIRQVGQREGHGVMSAKWWGTSGNGTPL